MNSTACFAQIRSRMAKIPLWLQALILVILSRALIVLLFLLWRHQYGESSGLFHIFQRCGADSRRVRNAAAASRVCGARRELRAALTLGRRREKIRRGFALRRIGFLFLFSRD